MADISTNTEGSAPIGTLRVMVVPDFNGFTEALENGLRDAEESASPLLAILTRIEDHLRVIASAHEPSTITVDGRRVVGAIHPHTSKKEA